jgi:ribosomal protein L16 Arg81 hydroxylase
MPGALDTYRWLLAPLAPEEFERTYYGRQVCVIRREQRDYYASLLSLEALDGILRTHSARHPDIQVVKHGADIASASYANGQGAVDARKAASLFADGATLIFSYLQQRVPALSTLCSDLGGLYSSRFQANVYLTPPHAQGFPTHWDTHDVFVLQVEGSKQWQIFDTKIVNPLIGQRFDHAVDVPGPLTSEFELRAGDVAYVPRGLMHAAHATDEHSLHITLGVMAFTWTDLLLECVGASALSQETLRESLPIGFARPEFSADQRREALQQRLRTLVDSVDADAVFSRLAAQLDPTPIPDGGLLSAALHPAAVEPAARFKRRADASWSLTCDDEGCHVTTVGSTIRFPAIASPLLRAIERIDRFTLSDLPDVVDDDGKVTVLRHLVRHGIVSVEA